MANTVIQLKKSTTTSAVPSSLADGELAINIADGALYFKASNSAIKQINHVPQTFGTVSANGTMIIADSLADIISINPGENISITGNSITDTITISSDISPAFSKANSAYDTSVASFNQSNTHSTQIVAAYDQSNAAYNLASTSITADGGEIVDGSLMFQNSTLGNGGNPTRSILYPTSGPRYTATAPVGAIAIKLPVLGSADMIETEIQFRSHETNQEKNFTLFCGGYNHSSGWTRTYAYLIGNPEANNNLTVRFGNDGSNDYILVGDTDTTWAYTSIMMKNLSSSYNNGLDQTDWTTTGVLISYNITDFSPYTINSTITNTQVFLDAPNDDSQYLRKNNEWVSVESGISLSGGSLILDADEDSYIQSTGDDYWLVKAGNQTVSEHGFAGSAYHYFYGHMNLYTTKFRGSSLTISGGAVTATRSHHRIDTESAAATDDLITINSPTEDMFLFLRAVSADRTVVIKEGGNIYLNEGRPIVLDEYRQCAILWSDGSYWYEVSRPDKWNYETIQSASGTAIDFTGLGGAREIEIFFKKTSLTGTDNHIVQIGDSGGIETTGYDSTSDDYAGTTTFTNGFGIRATAATYQLSGVMTLRNYDGNIWIAHHSMKRLTNVSLNGIGEKELTGQLDRLRITRTGTNTFDNGAFRVRWR